MGTMLSIVEWAIVLGVAATLFKGLRRALKWTALSLFVLIGGLGLLAVGFRTQPKPAPPPVSAPLTIEQYPPQPDRTQAPIAPQPVTYAAVSTPEAAKPIPARSALTVSRKIAQAAAPVYFRRRGGCGSRGGAGYRLPNGRCASRRG